MKNKKSYFYFNSFYPYDPTPYVTDGDYQGLIIQE